MMSRQPILVDSNILIYALNDDSPKQAAAQAFLQRERRNLLVAHQNIFETLRVLTHSSLPKPLSIAEATKAVQGITDSLSIITPDYKTHLLALELLQKYHCTGNQIFDTYLAATALANGITTIATDNAKDFQRFTELSVSNPFA